MARKLTARALRTADRRRRAIELRRAGKTFRAISAELGISLSSVHGLIQRHLVEILKATDTEAKLLIVEELDRLDALWAAAWPKALDGSAHHIGELLKIHDRRLKLYGLDGPARVALTVPRGVKPYHSQTPAREPPLLQELLDLLDGGTGAPGPEANRTH